MTKTFEEIIKGIRKAVLGVEVREDIAQGMEYVEQFATTATQKAGEAASSAAEAKKASQDTEAAKETAVSAINAAKSEATDEINTEKSGALSAIGEKKAESLQELSKKQGEALDEISRSVSTAQDAAGTAVREAAAAAGSASNAAESEKNAKASADAAQEHQTGAEAAQKKAEDAADRAAATVSTDKTLTVENAPADAKAVGDRINAIKIETDKTLTISGAAADAKASGDALAEKVGKDVILDSEGNVIFYSKAEVDALLKNLNVCPFEIGDILQTTSSVSPAARWGGTWEEIAPDRVLMGASSTHAAGTTAEAGLPNITGFLPAPKDEDYYYANWPISGAFAWSGAYADGETDVNHTKAEFENSTNARGHFGRADFNAARSSAIYGRSSTVQPAAYYVHYWQRKA